MKAVAFMMEKNDRCQMCGTAKWEWDEKQGGSRFAYEAVEEICQGCLRKAAAHETSGSQPGTNVILVPTHTVEYAKRHARMEKQWREDKLAKAKRSQ